MHMESGEPRDLGEKGGHPSVTHTSHQDEPSSAHPPTFNPFPSLLSILRVGSTDIPLSSLRAAGDGATATGPVNVIDLTISRP